MSSINDSTLSDEYGIVNASLSIASIFLFRLVLRSLCKSGGKVTTEDI